jgi:hypothetical protein
MEQLAEIWESVVASMRALPPPHDPDLMVVVATIVGGLGLAAATNGWVERRVSKSGVFATLVGVLLLFWVWSAQQKFGFEIIPEAFIEIIARIIR